MLERVRRFLGRVFAPALSLRRTLALEAAAAARSAGPGTLVVLVDARYLPHGGRDRLTLRLRSDGGHVERMRSRGRDEPRQGSRALDAEESRRVMGELAARDAWNLGDHREPVLDGLDCLFALADGDRVCSLHLHAGAGDSQQRQLMSFLLALLPVAAPSHPTTSE
jgi:hypothetical protein